MREFSEGYAPPAIAPNIQYRGDTWDRSRMVNDDTIGPEEFWVTLRTVSARWEAESIAALLAAYEIPVRIVDLGFHAYLGQGSPAALQVRSGDRWTALLLVSDPEAGDSQ